MPEFFPVNHHALKIHNLLLISLYTIQISSLKNLKIFITRTVLPELLKGTLVLTNTSQYHLGEK
jgi:hypothetical protein